MTHDDDSELVSIGRGWEPAGCWKGDWVKEGLIVTVSICDISDTGGYLPPVATHDIRPRPDQALVGVLAGVVGVILVSAW